MKISVHYCRHGSFKENLPMLFHIFSNTKGRYKIKKVIKRTIERVAKTPRWPNITFHKPKQTAQFILPRTLNIMSQWIKRNKHNIGYIPSPHRPPLISPCHCEGEKDRIQGKARVPHEPSQSLSNYRPKSI